MRVETDDRPEGRVYLFDGGTGPFPAYRADWGDPPPEGVTVQCIDEVGATIANPTGFAGVYRTALALDLNAQRPAFLAKDPFGPLPGREFTQDLEEALGAPLREIGISH